MQKKSTIVLFLVFTFLFSFVYSDDSLKTSSWAKKEIEAANSEGLIPYYVKNSLTKPIDRKNFAQLLILSLKKEHRVNINLVAEDTFKDVERNDPFFGFIGAAKHYNLINGRTEDLFDKNAKITRKEAIVSLGRLSKYYIKSMEYDPNDESLKTFFEGNEYKNLEDWAKHSVSYFIQAKLLNGDGKGLYKLNEEITAEEAIVLSTRFIKHLHDQKEKAFTPEEKKIINDFKDAEQKNSIDYGAKTYEITPNTDPKSLNVGKMSTSNIQNALNSVNNIRLAAGVPPVTMDEEYNKRASFGAFLLDMTNQLNRTPEQKNAPDYVYKIGKEGVSSSNIGKGFTKMNDFNMFGARNEKLEYFSTLTERRWLINPNMSKMGAGMSGSIASTYVLDENRTPEIHPDFVAYPAAVAFPADYLKNGPWSIQFGGEFTNPEQTYRIPKYETPVVKLTRLRDNKTVVFDKETEKVADGNFFYHIDRTNYGYGAAIIFRPNFTPQPTERFKVEITGLIKESTGEKTSLVYETVFF